MASSRWYFLMCGCLCALKFVAARVISMVGVLFANLLAMDWPCRGLVRLACGLTRMGVAMKVLGLARWKLSLALGATSVSVAELARSHLKRPESTRHVPRPP